VIQDSDVHKVECGFQAPGYLFVGLGDFGDPAGVIMGNGSSGLSVGKNGALIKPRGLF
jgi:hypothetical protein